MNIYEIAKKTNVPLKSLRKLEKAGLLKVDKTSSRLSELVFHMKGNMLYTLPMLVDMIATPSLVDEIGYENLRYKSRAIEQIAALGDVKATSAPAAISAEIVQAAKGDDDAAFAIAGWLMNVLPVEPVTHHWIAARLLVPLSEFLREFNAPLLPLALAHVRKLPEFSTYWRLEKIGQRQRVFYSKPLDL